MGSIILNKDDFTDKNYVLANTKSFFQRYVDTGFKTKWCGFWSPPVKYLDYYAYKINLNGHEFWLSWENADKIILNKWGVTHIFKVLGAEIHEDVVLPNESIKGMISVIRIKNQTGGQAKVRINVEAAVDMRTKYENYHEREYKVHFDNIRSSQMVKCNNKSWHFMMGLGDVRRRVFIDHNERAEYRTHSPGEKLRCMIPGNYSVSFDLVLGEEAEIPFVFSGSKKSLPDLTRNFDKIYKHWQSLIQERKKNEEEKDNALSIHTPDDELNDAFSWARWSLNSLYHEGEHVTGLFAGYPWFLEFWARDSFISALGLTSVDEIEKTKTILSTFRKKGLPSKIELDGKMNFGFADTQPWFLLAGMHYLTRTNDTNFSRFYNFAAKNIIREIELDDGLVNHDPKTTWMDTLERHYAIEIQSLWALIMRAFKNKKYKKIEKAMESEYWNDEETYFADSLVVNGKRKKSDVVTSNPVFHLALAEVDSIRAIASLEKMRFHFQNKWGISTYSKDTPGYSCEGYHNGSSWGLTTGFGAMACFKHDDTGLGIKYLKSLANDIYKNTLGGIFETVSSCDGKLLGCGMQAWSMGIFLYTIVEYLFGIRYDAMQKRLYLRPSIPDEWPSMSIKGKEIAGKRAEVKFTKGAEKINVDIIFDSLPKGVDCMLEIPEIDKYIINGKKKSGNSVKFNLEKVNHIECIR